MSQADIDAVYRHLSVDPLDWAARLVLADLLEEVDPVLAQGQRWQVANRKSPHWSTAYVGSNSWRWSSCPLDGYWDITVPDWAWVAPLPCWCRGRVRFTLSHESSLDKGLLAHAAGFGADGGLYRLASVEFTSMAEAERALAVVLVATRAWRTPGS